MDSRKVIERIQNSKGMWKSDVVMDEIIKDRKLTISQWSQYILMLYALQQLQRALRLLER